MNNRRRFIALAPFAGAAFLVACSKESATSDTAPAAAPMPAPAPAMPTPGTDPAPSSTGTAPAEVSGAELPMLEESDPLAVGLGYVSVASTVDLNKYPKYTPGEACATCSLFGGQTGAARGPCPLFVGKHVMATGWCSAYAKKAG